MSDYGYCPACGEPGVKRLILMGMTKCLNGHKRATAQFHPPVAATIRERPVEQYFIDAVHCSGGSTRKVQWPGYNGAPDRLAGWPNGRHGLVELKRPRGQAEAHQLREHTRLRAMGLRVDILDTREAVDAYVKEMTS